MDDVAAVSAHVGYAIHGDWTYPGEPRAGNVRVAIEVQGKWYTVGVMATPSRTKEAYVYAGVAHTFSAGRFDIRPTLAVGAFYEQSPRHPWHSSLRDGWSDRYMAQLEVRYRLTPRMSVGLVANRISTLDNKTDLDAPHHLWDQGGAGTFVGATISRRIK